MLRNPPALRSLLTWLLAACVPGPCQMLTVRSAELFTKVTTATELFGTWGAHVTSSRPKHVQLTAHLDLRASVVSGSWWTRLGVISNLTYPHSAYTMRGSCMDPPPDEWALSEWQRGQCVLYFPRSLHRHQHSLFDFVGVPGTPVRLLFMSLYVIHAGPPVGVLTAADAADAARELLWQGGASGAAASAVSVWAYKVTWAGTQPETQSLLPGSVLQRIGRIHMQHSVFTGGAGTALDSMAIVSCYGCSFVDWRPARNAPMIAFYTKVGSKQMQLKDLILPATDLDAPTTVDVLESPGGNATGLNRQEQGTEFLFADKDLPGTSSAWRAFVQGPAHEAPAGMFIGFGNPSTDALIAESFDSERHASRPGASGEGPQDVSQVSAGGRSPEPTLEVRNKERSARLELCVALAVLGVIVMLGALLLAVLKPWNTDSCGHHEPAASASACLWLRRIFRQRGDGRATGSRTGNFSAAMRSASPSASQVGLQAPATAGSTRLGSDGSVSVPVPRARNALEWEAGSGTGLCACNGDVPNREAGNWPLDDSARWQDLAQAQQSSSWLAPSCSSSVPDGNDLLVTPPLPRWGGLGWTAALPHLAPPGAAWPPQYTGRPEAVRPAAASAYGAAASMGTHQSLFWGEQGSGAGDSSQLQLPIRLPGEQSAQAEQPSCSRGRSLPFRLAYMEACVWPEALELSLRVSSTVSSAVRCLEHQPSACDSDDSNCVAPPWPLHASQGSSPWDPRRSHELPLPSMTRAACRGAPMGSAKGASDYQPHWQPSTAGIRQHWQHAPTGHFCGLGGPAQYADHIAEQASEQTGCSSCCSPEWTSSLSFAPLASPAEPPDAAREALSDLSF